MWLTDEEADEAARLASMAFLIFGFFRKRDPFFVLVPHAETATQELNRRDEREGVERRGKMAWSRMRLGSAI